MHERGKEVRGLVEDVMFAVVERSHDTITLFAASQTTRRSHKSAGIR
jgi:hypothetical protein